MFVSLSEFCPAVRLVCAAFKVQLVAQGDAASVPFLPGSPSISGATFRTLAGSLTGSADRDALFHFIPIDGSQSRLRPPRRPQHGRQKWTCPHYANSRLPAGACATRTSSEVKVSLNNFSKNVTGSGRGAPTPTRILSGDVTASAAHIAMGRRDC